MEIKRQKECEFTIVKDANGHDIVVANDILFKGKRNIDWDDVEGYTQKFIGRICEVADTGDMIYISKDFPDEFTGSKDTRNLRGASAKAKANTAQCIPEMIKIAVNKRYQVNLDAKHNKNAKYGWYRFDTRTAIPVLGFNDEIERYNVFKMEVLVRCDEDGKLYLYDIVNIKKETSNPLQR